MDRSFGCHIIGNLHFCPDLDMVSGDYEIWLGNRMNNRRTERGAFFPPFWKTDSHYVVVEFSKQLNLSEPEEIFIAAEGKYNVKLDGKLQFGMRKPYCFRPGHII